MPAEERRSGAPRGAVVERVLHLKKVPIIGSLPATQLALVAEHAQERFFQKGSLLLRAGEPVSAVHFILDGKVHCTRGERLLGHAGPGAGVGGLGILARDASGIEAVAEADTLALSLEAEAILEIFEDHFPVQLHVLREMCRQLVDRVTRPPFPRTAPLDPFPHDQRIRFPERALDLVERIFFLRQVAPFARSSISALSELSRAMAEIRFDPGTALWRVGDAPGSVYLLVSGEVLCTTPEARSFPLSSGAPLGPLESLAERPRWYDAVTQTSVSCLQGNIEGLIDVFEDNFEMAADYMAVVAKITLDIVEGDAGATGLGAFYGCDVADASAAAVETAT